MAGMSRPWRIEFAGACYHVINRGNYRRELFNGTGAAEAFERTLDEAAQRFGWAVHAYVVMSNHYHLAVELGEPNLAAGMQWLQSTWVRRYNGFRKLIGRPFQGRYKALLVEPGEPFGRVCHYIHLNPARAGLVEGDHLADYPWGSLPKFAQDDRPEWLDPITVLEQAGRLPDTAAGWKRYRTYLAGLVGDRASAEELAAEKLSQGWCVGSPQFRQEMRREALARGMHLELERFSGIEPEHFAAERAQLWSERLEALARADGTDLQALPRPKSAPEKVRLAAAMKRTTAASNGWLATQLAMGQPASVSQFVRRWELDPSRRREIDRLQSRVKA